MSALRRVSIPSPNHSGRTGGPQLIVIHTAEGSRDFRSLGNFFANPSSGVSSQTGIDDEPGVIGEYVRRDRASWTQASFNSAAISTELCAFAKWDRQTWISEHRVMLENCRRWIAEECAVSGIPLLRIGVDAAQGSGRGVCGHVDLGSRGGGHWDPGPGFPWDLVLGSPIEVPPAVPPGLAAAVVDIVRLGDGYAMAAADGGVFAFGPAPFCGSLGGRRLNAPIVGMAASPSGQGYWLAGADGGVFTFGDAGFHGSIGSQRLNAPIVGIAAHPAGDGYWLAGADGGVFNFGSAPFRGSAAETPLNAQVVDVSSSGEGYVLCASDGGVFAFGCPFHGSAGAWRLNQPVTGIAGRDDGLGYHLVAADGGLFAFGQAGFAGSMGGHVLAWPAVGIATRAGSGSGYWIGAADGGVFALDVPFHGSVQG